MGVTRGVLLGVNIDHVATLRQQRGTRYPDVLQAALVSEQSGADAITVHLREDRRHIQERDVRLISESILSRLNLEMAATEEMLNIARQVRPHDCCLVPEKREELTTEGGLDVVGNLDFLRNYCGELADAGIRVSLFIDPDRDQIEAAKQIQVPVIELHTGSYADAESPEQRQIEQQKIELSAAHAHGLGLQVNAGHGLDYHNVQSIAAIPEIVELNIGHSIVSRALFSGLANAVSDMKKAISSGP